MFFSYFSQETGVDISNKLSPVETNLHEMSNPFPGKNKKNILNCLLKILPSYNLHEMSKPVSWEKYFKLSTENFTQPAKR